MQDGAPSLIEPELQLQTPRPVRMTAAGRRKLALSTAPAAAALALGTLLFLSRPQPRWLDVLFALFVLAGLGVLYRMVALWRARVRLVESGAPVLATVVAKEETRGETALYYCWYEAADKQWGLGWTGGWRDAEIGDTVTILYSPDEPGRAVAYRAAGCEVVQARAEHGAGSEADAETAQSALNPKI